MLQNVERGMVRDDEGLFRRQIVALLANPRMGPVSAAAIAANLGVAPDRIADALDTLIRMGSLVRVSPDAYTAPPVVDGQPLRSHPYLAPGATPLYVPESLRGDWLLVEEGVTGNAVAAELRGGSEKYTTEETGGTEGRAEGDRGTAEEETRQHGEGVEGADGASGSRGDGRRA